MKSKLIILKSEIKKDLEKLQNLLEKFVVSYREYKQEKKYAFLVESAFYVNQIYTGFERIFENVADCFENNIDERSWHKSLLERMSLDLENIRPPLISESNLSCLDELRAFRHFFRHAYDFDLKEEKFSLVASKVHELEKNYRQDLEQFIRFIDELLKD